MPLLLPILHLLQATHQCGIQLMMTDTIEMQIEGVDIEPLMRNVAPTRPDVGEGANALLLYTTLRHVYNLYMAEMALHTAYMAAIEAEMEADDDAVE